MWTDNYSPGCLYDTVDCIDCGCCSPSPLEEYLKEEDEKNMKSIDTIEQNDGSFLLTVNLEKHELEFILNKAFNDILKDYILLSKTQDKINNINDK